MAFYRTFCALALVLLPGLLRAEKADAAAPASAAEEMDAAEEVDAAAEKGRPSRDARFERYRTIIDRKPFGPEPANFDPDAPGSRGGGAGGGGAADPAAQEAMKAQEEQKIIASVRVSALNVTPFGKIAVGFTDASKQPSGTYYLKVGETRDGWTVKAADARAMKVTLEKDGVEATLGLGEGSADSGKGGGKAKAAAGAAVRPQLGALARAGLLRPPVSAAATPPGASAEPEAGGNALRNLRARRALKDAERAEEAKRQAAAAEQARADREKAAAEREQQREALVQIQEELRRQREQKEQERQRRQQEEAQTASGDAPGDAPGQDAPEQE